MLRHGNFVTKSSGSPVWVSTERRYVAHLGVGKIDQRHSVIGWKGDGVPSVSLSVSVSECGSSAACKKLGPQLPLIGGNQTVQTHAKNYPRDFHIPFVSKPPDFVDRPDISQ
jgi:hypothetical protein